MCGICGLVDFRSEGRIDPELIERMTATLTHRGPDRQATTVVGPAALGHARLSIIDLSEAGNQPMQTPGGRYTLVYNGEVYNADELRRDLEQNGTAFRGHSDSEVVLRGFERWGTDVFRRMNGIFALGVWDRVSEQLVLARDRFGVKPLYYAAIANGLVFGSEIKSILASRRVIAQMDAQGLHEFAYFGNSLGTRTLFDAVNKLEPGHWMLLTRDGVSRSAFWSARDVSAQDDDIETAVGKTRGLLEAAVRRQLVSDVPVGIFLSGGIDSSAVTAYASRHYTGRIRTYSVGFDFDRGVNELPKARRVASHFDTEHTELQLAGGDVPDVVESLVRHHDAPFSDAANIPLYLLCRELDGEPRVVLQGDGGDEIFAGYRRYALMSHLQWWRVLARLRGVVGQLPGSAAQRLHRILDAFGHADRAERSASLLTLDTPTSSLALHLSSHWMEAVSGTDPFLRYREVTHALRSLDPVEQLLRTDIQILLPDIFLEKVDRSTMAFGIESRVPFLDNDLTDYVIGLPSALKVRGKEKKRLLRRALRGVVPDYVLDGPKTGFGVPYSHWLATSLYPYARDVLSAEIDRPDSIFHESSLLTLLEAHRAGPAERSGFILWKALNLALWKREYLTSS